MEYQVIQLLNKGNQVCVPILRARREPDVHFNKHTIVINQSPQVGGAVGGEGEGIRIFKETIAIR